MRVVKVEVYYTVKICFSGKMWACLGESWRSAATRCDRIGEKIEARARARAKKKSVYYTEIASGKKDKKNALDFTLEH